MIPHMNIIAWSNIAPWAALRQVEQDLIISRAVIDVFSDEYLLQELRFRGGTALNKLHFPEPLRYSEDIDLVCTSERSIGPVLDQLRKVLALLGHANYDTSPVAPSLIFRTEAEDGAPQLRLKVEINTCEREAYDGSITMPHTVENPWFTGHANIPTFTNEGMLATKLCVLLERDKGRDLFDLSHALTVFDGLDTGRVAALFVQYLKGYGKTLSHAQAEQRILAKLTHPGFLTDVRPLLSADDADALTDEAINTAFMDVFDGLIAQIPGAPWEKNDEKLTQFGLVT